MFESVRFFWLCLVCQKIFGQFYAYGEKSVLNSTVHRPSRSHAECHGLFHLEMKSEMFL